MRIHLVLTVAAVLTASSSGQIQGAQREWLHWDGVRADGSLYGGRLSVALVPRSLHRIPAPVTTLHGTYGAAAVNRVDLVMVGDGYTSGEQGQFQQDAAVMTVSFFNHEPFTTYQNYFAVYMVTVVSNDSGVDNDPNQGINKDTALDMGFWCSGIERLLCVNVGKAYSYANNAPDVDQVIALANSSKYGGAGYTSSNLATSSGQNGSSSEVVVHELGHSFGNLADEYDYGGGTTWTGGEVPEPNVSILDATAMANAGTKWADWLGVTQPTFDGLVSTYEGARYYQKGIYRPTYNSLMRALNRPFNLPSVESLLIELYKIVSPIDGSSDESSIYDGSEVLFVQPVMLVGGAPLSVQWHLDGAAIPGESGTQLDLSQLNLSPCGHTVQAVVVDPTTWVRDETARDTWMTDSRTFTLNVPGPGSTDCDGDGQPDDCQIAADPSLDWNGDGVLDSCSAPNYCQANANSSGQAGFIGATGSPVIADNSISLTAVFLPSNEFGYFLMSNTQDYVPLFGGSAGNLCLGGQILRFSKPPSGQVLNTGVGGFVVMPVDLGVLPGATIVAPGEHWYFQLWFRDQQTSNTTNGLDVMLR